MNSLVDSLRIIVTRKDSRKVMIVSTCVLIFLLFLAQNGRGVIQIFSLTSLPFLRKLVLTLHSFFDVTSTFTSGSLILVTLGSCLGGINISLAYTYMKIRGEVILKSGLYSGIGLVFAFLGIGCAACGTALLSVILGFFGFSTMLALLPYQGAEIGYVGIIFLLIATYVLAKKVSAPNVC